jgi:dimethylargininase
MWIAITRPVSPSIGACELTHLARQPIDVPRAVAQHAAYEDVLRSLGASLVRVAAAPDLPDAVFVEDTAIVLDEVAVLTRSGAPSRRAELPEVAAALTPYRPVVALREPATLDGGDVLQVGRTLYVGRSSRSNDEGIRQLEELATLHGYETVAVAVEGCLHLKSAVTVLADDLLLLNPAWVSPGAFPRLRSVVVDEAEPYAANGLRLGETVVYPAHFPRTRDRLVESGLRLAITECDELAKAEGAVTCCSLVFAATNPRNAPRANAAS